MNDNATEHKNGGDAVRQWLTACPGVIPQQHMILLNNFVYATYDNYQDALYDYNMLKQDPNHKILLLKNYWISGYNNGCEEQITSDIATTLTLRYDTAGYE